MRVSKWAAVFTLQFALMARFAFADGLIRDGVGATAMGRGGVNLGFADTGAMILDNPAAMRNIASDGLFDVSSDTLICDIEYSDLDNLGADPSMNGYPLATIGYVSRNPESPWAWGVGVFAPAGFGAGYFLNNPATGLSRYKSFGAMAKVLPGVAYEVNDRLSIGAAFGLAISHVEIEGPYYIQTGAFAGTPILIDLQFTDAAPTGNIGLQYRLTPQTILGLSYTEQTDFSLDGRARAQIGPLLSGFDTQMNMTWPRSLGLGVMHDFCECSRVGIDVIWFDWSQAFDQLPLTFSNPSDPVVAALIGPQLQDVFPLDWHDTVSYRFGYEHSPSDLFTWRVGYIYHKSPVANATLNPYLDGILEHLVSIGCSRSFGATSLNLAYQFSWSPERNIVDSTIVGDDFDNSTLRAQTHWIGVSLVTVY